MQIFTTCLKVVPRYVIVNKCNRQMALMQENTDERVYLRVGEKKDWFWEHKDEVKHLIVTVSDN